MHKQIMLSAIRRFLSHFPLWYKIQRFWDEILHFGIKISFSGAKFFHLLIRNPFARDKLIRYRDEISPFPAGKGLLGPSFGQRH
jgi:hypothetical protein